MQRRFPSPKKLGNGFKEAHAGKGKAGRGNKNGIAEYARMMGYSQPLLFQLGHRRTGRN